MMFHNSKNEKHSLRHHLASRLRQLRAARNWSQEQLAAASGLHRTYISLIERERCNVSLDNIERLANALDVLAADLLRTAVASHSPTQWAFAS